MHYFEQIRAFRLIQRTRQELQAPAVALWYALLGTSNELGHPESFGVALSSLAHDAGLSLSGVKRARETLARSGLIEWQAQPGRACARYRMLDITMDYTAREEAAREPQSEPQTEPQSEPQTGPQSEPQSEPHTGPIHYTKTKTNQTQKTPPQAPQGEGEGVKDAFEAFWEGYPRKAGKETARRAYRRLAPGTELQGRMLDALSAQRQGEQWQREGGRFIPHPATWLSQRRWEDEPVLAGEGRAGMKRGAEGFRGLALEQRYPQRHYDPALMDGPSSEAIREAMKL